MGIIDRVRTPSLHATSSLPRIIASADSGVAQDNTVSGVAHAAQPVNLADLYGFLSGLYTSRVQFQETSLIQTYARLNPRQFILSAVDSPHDRSEDLDARYRTLPAVFNDSRTEFGKQSVRIEAETARWLALLHEIGIIFALVRALKDVCFFKELPKTLEKHSNFIKGTGECLNGLTAAIIGYINKSTRSGWINLTWDGIKSVHSKNGKDISLVCRAPIRTLPCTSADARLCCGYYTLGEDNMFEPRNGDGTDLVILTAHQPQEGVV